MSLILDALNRSRRDAEQIPGLASEHFADPVAADTGWMQWLLVGALALAVLLIGWLLLDKTPTREAVVDTPAAVTAPAEPQRPEKPAPMPAPRSKPDADPAPAVAVAPPPRPAPAAGPRATQPAAAMAPAQQRRPAVDSNVAALYQQAPQESQARAAQPAVTSREEETIDLEQLVVLAETELADARLSEHEVPFLSAMSQQTKDAIPTLMYLRHDYSGDTARSSVLLNGKTVKVGGAVGGVRVQEILPDSVVLEFQGTRFRLRALNSWVNL